VTSDPTQLQRNEVTHHVTATQAPNDQSALPDNCSAPTPTNHDRESYDVTAVRTNGVSAACSRSSSRSSGFDEISSSVTEWSLLPVTTAHAHDRPEMTSSKTADDGEEDEAKICVNERTCESEDDDDAGSLQTLRTTGDSQDNDHDEKTELEVPPQTGSSGADQQQSCSSQVTEETNSETSDVNVEELSRQIESMSERFNQLFARVKAAEQAELRRSTSSLSESYPRQQPRSVVNSSPDVTESKYSRNTAYRRWLIAKTGCASDRNINRTHQPITAADNVALTTDDEPANHVIASSALIGQQAYDDVTAADEEVQPSVTPADFDDFIRSASTNGVTSEMDEYDVSEVERRSRSGEEMTKWCEQETERTDRTSQPRQDVSSDLDSTFKPSVDDNEACEEESLSLKCPQENVVHLQRSDGVLTVTLQSERSQSVDELNVMDDQPRYACHSLPRSTSSTRHSAADDELTRPRVTPSSAFTHRSLTNEPAPSWQGLASRRLFPLHSSPGGGVSVLRTHRSSPSSSPAQSPDLFTDHLQTSSWRTASRTFSQDSVPRLMLTRRRYLLFVYCNVSIYKIPNISGNSKQNCLSLMQCQHETGVSAEHYKRAVAIFCTSDVLTSLTLLYKGSG